MVLVKDDKPDGPGYLVIAGDLTGDEAMEPAFNFWCLARDLKEIAPRHLHCYQLGEWGHKQSFPIRDPGLEERQKLARVYGPRGGRGFLAAL